MLTLSTLDHSEYAASTWSLAQRFVARGVGPRSAAMQQELLERLRTTIARLPEGLREVLILKYVEQMKSEEIAVVLGIGLRAVQVRHRQALTKMNHWLKNDESEPFPGKKEQP